MSFAQKSQQSSFESTYFWHTMTHRKSPSSSAICLFDLTLCFIQNIIKMRKVWTRPSWWGPRASPRVAQSRASRIVSGLGSSGRSNGERSISKLTLSAGIMYRNAKTNIMHLRAVCTQYISVHQPQAQPPVESVATDVARVRRSHTRTRFLFWEDWNHPLLRGTPGQVKSCHADDRCEAL